jgi:hypothetical protein
MSPRLLRNVLVALLFASSAAQVSAQPPDPGAADQVNPINYALQEADLPEGMSIKYGPIVEDYTAYLEYPDADGNLVRQGWPGTRIWGEIVVGEEREGDVGAPTVKLNLLIFDTPERAIDFARQHHGEHEGDPNWMVNANELGDPRITADGGSKANERTITIRYRKFLAEFTYYGDMTYVEAAGNTPVLARLWLDKVAGGPSAGVDLDLMPATIYLRRSSSREPAADRQYVAALIHNSHTAAPARGVQARLSVQMPGDDEYTPVQVVDISGTIKPGALSKPGTATFEWDLQGEQVTLAGLLVDAWTDDQREMNPGDNHAGLEVSIYYAHNGTRAYRWREDSHGFKNYSVDDEDLSGMVKGLLATIVGEMYTDPQAGELLSRMFFPQTYMRFRDYLSHSLQTGVGGHCYGMSATAGLYFMDSSLRPGGASTSALTRDAADPNIKLYQHAQMVPIARALINGDKFFERNWDSLKCLDTVRQKLRDERKPVLLSLAGKEQVQEQVTVNGQTQTQQVEKSWGHAVLAYKLVDVTGYDSVIYVYDPNLPPTKHPGDSPMSAILINPNNGRWETTSDMSAIYRTDGSTLTGIAAREVTREISVAESNAIMPDLMEKLREMAAFLEKTNKVMAVLGCPADVYFTDQSAQGRRTGYINGQRVNEIPGAELRTTGEVEIYILPAGEPLTVTITGTDKGVANFDIIRPENGNPAITSFLDMPVRAGGGLSGTLESGGEIAMLAGDGARHAPTLTGSLAGDRVTWEQPAGPGPTPTPTGAPAAVPNLSGEWAMNANTYRTTLTLQHEGNRLTGTVFRAALEDGAVLADGTVKFTRPGANQVYTGRFNVEPDGTWRLSGTFDCGATRTGGSRWAAARDPRGGEAPTPRLPERQEEPAARGPTVTPTPAPTPAQNEEIIVCREVVDGKPVGAATVFPDAAKITILHRYRDQAAGTAEALWFRNDALLTRSERQIKGGNGWVSFSVIGGGGASLPTGNYEVRLSLPGRAPLRANFTIGGGAG